MSYKHVVMTQFGGPEVLQTVEEPYLPEPLSGEVRIRELVASAAFTDVMIRKGKYPGIQASLPFSPGYDMVGIVDKLGPETTEFEVGQRVAALTVTGAYSEYICLPESSLVHVPEGLDSAEAVSLILSYVTPYQMLHRLVQVKPGQRILVHGAGGAVGTAMLQLGKLLDLEMYGTDTASKQALIASLGAVPLDHEHENLTECLRALTGEGFDAIFDPIGGRSLPRSFRLLKPGGMLVAYGFQTAVLGKGGSVPLDLIRLKLWDWLPNGRSTRFYSIGALYKQHPDWFKADLRQLFELLDQGQLKPVIAGQIPLSEAKLAHEAIEAGNVQGKIVLTMA